MISFDPNPIPMVKANKAAARMIETLLVIISVLTPS